MNRYNEIKDEMDAIAKRPTIAMIGGFRPNPDEKSWFGGNFLCSTYSPWVSDNSGNMIPIIQIYVPDLNNGKELFGDVELVQVYLNQETLPIGMTKNGNGWIIKEYKTIENMVSCPTPNDVAILKSFPIHWELHKEYDYPCWEECWNYVDLDYVNKSEELTEEFFDDYDNYNNTKVGGYASYIQSPPSFDMYNYVFQISSEEKPRFNIADSGNLYFYKSKDNNEWFMHWDCY